MTNSHSPFRTLDRHHLTILSILADFCASLTVTMLSSSILVNFAGFACPIAPNWIHWDVERGR